MPGKEFYKDMMKSEQIVAQYLNEIGVDWYFEQPVFLYDERKRPRVWAPDFYLPAFQVYLEVCGSKDFDYSYREDVYQKNGVPVVFLHLYKEKKDWQKWLKANILKLEENRHSKVMELLEKLLMN